jgi:hypothetical protein
MTVAMKTFFVTTIGSTEEEGRVLALIDGLRKFGGVLKDCPLWIFAPDPGPSDSFSAYANIEWFPLAVDGGPRNFPFSRKVLACAKAEETASPEPQCMVWVSPNCLLVNPPVLFDLGEAYDLAVRPVHVRNVGSPVREPPDGFWEGIYRTVGIGDTSFTVESYVDSQILRPYFNTHCFSINTGKRIMQSWRGLFQKMVAEGTGRVGPLGDELHRVFLHQALLSTLLVNEIERRRICILPPEYSYPLHLQEEIPEPRRIRNLKDMVCAAYEERGDIRNIHVDEPLRSWLHLQKCFQSA